MKRKHICYYYSTAAAATRSIGSCCFFYILTNLYFVHHGCQTRWLCRTSTHYNPPGIPVLRIAICLWPRNYQPDMCAVSSAQATWWHDVFGSRPTLRRYLPSIRAPSGPAQGVRRAVSPRANNKLLPKESMCVIIVLIIVFSNKRHVCNVIQCANECFRCS